MKLTSVEPIGRSQLIPGVGRTVERGARPTTDQAGGPTLDVIVQGILLETVQRAALCGSGEIRISVHGDELQVAHRIVGEFHVGMVVPAEWFARVERTLKLMANTVLADPRKPQNGRLRRAAVVEGRFIEFEMSVSTMPGPAGDTITLTVEEALWGEPASDPTPRILPADTVLFRRRARGRPTRS